MLNNRQQLLGLLLLFWALLFFSCGRRIVRHTYEHDDLDGIFSLRGRARIEFDSPDYSGNVESEIYVQKPNSVRIDIFMPFVGNVARILLNGGETRLFDFSNRQVLIPENEETDILRQIIGLPVGSDRAVDLLLFSYFDPDYHSIGDTLIVFQDSYLVYESKDLDFPPEIMYLMNDYGDFLKIEYSSLILNELLDDNLFDYPYMRRADTIVVKAVGNDTR